MRKHLSRVYFLIAAVYVVAPLLLTGLGLLFFEIPPSRMISLFLSPFFYIVAAATVLAGVCLWELKRTAWYVMVGANILLLYELAVMVTDYGERPNRLTTFLFCAGAILYFTFRIRIELYVPYFFPRIRWWESSAEYAGIRLPAQVVRPSGEVVSVEILDFSRKGCFAKTRQDFWPDEPVTLQFRVAGQPVNCRGLVVWRAESSIPHPKGIGVRFSYKTIREFRKVLAIDRKIRKTPLADLHVAVHENYESSRTPTPSA